MKFNYKNKFIKKFKKLPKKIKEKAVNSLLKYQKWTHDQNLNLHRLTWKLKKYWSINVTGDIRILLDPKTWDIVDVITIWTHSELYK